MVKRRGSDTGMGSTVLRKSDQTIRTTVYDNQTRGMLQTPQRWPRAGSQTYPSPAAEANDDGSTTIWYSPEQPDGVPRGNWIQTDPTRGWFHMLRLYFPTKAFFDHSWRAGEVELVWIQDPRHEHPLRLVPLPQQVP